VDVKNKTKRDCQNKQQLSQLLRVVAAGTTVIATAAAYSNCSNQNNQGKSPRSSKMRMNEMKQNT